jgi:tetratricopeptide (TPR) repeat protein
MESINIVEHSNAKNVLIIFSARHTPKGKFTFSKRLNKIPATKIFINDLSNSWYQNGVSEYPTYSNLISFLDEKISYYLKEGGKVWTLGSSMGAYAALKFGSQLNADRIVAFSPEDQLGMKYSKSEENKVLVSENNVPLSSLTYKENSDVIVISNNGDPVDYYSANKLKDGIPDSKVYILNNFKHNVLSELSENIIIDNILYEMIVKGSSKSLAHITKSKVHGSEFAETFKEINENLIGGLEFKENYIETVEKLIKENPGWGYINYLYALCLDKKGFHSAAMKYYESCYKISPYLGRPIIRLAELHSFRNEHEDVLRYLEPFCKNKYNIKATKILTKTYLKLGLISSAIDAFDLFINKTKNNKDKKVIEILRANLTK